MGHVVASCFCLEPPNGAPGFCFEPSNGACPSQAWASTVLSCCVVIAMQRVSESSHWRSGACWGTPTGRLSKGLRARPARPKTHGHRNGGLSEEQNILFYQNDELPKPFPHKLPNASKAFGRLISAKMKPKSHVLLESSNPSRKSWGGVLILIFRCFH